MLSKTSVVMFPCSLLLYSWWRRGRIGRRDVLATAPFFAISIGLGLVTVCFQKQRGMEPGVLPLGGPASRLATLGLDSWFYLAKFLAPFDLLPVYPRWMVNPSSPRLLLPLAAFVAALAWLWLAAKGAPASGRCRRPNSRHVLFGIGFFLLNLAPILGLIPVAYFHLSWVADHFAYLPALGLIGLASGWRPQFWSGGLRHPSGCGMGRGRAVAAVLAVASRSYAAVFRKRGGAVGLYPPARAFVMVRSVGMAWERWC